MMWEQGVRGFDPQPPPQILVLLIRFKDLPDRILRKSEHLHIETVVIEYVALFYIYIISKKWSQGAENDEDNDKQLRVHALLVGGQRLAARKDVIHCHPLPQASWRHSDPNPFNWAKWQGKSTEVLKQVAFRGSKICKVAGVSLLLVVLRS